MFRQPTYPCQLIAVMSLLSRYKKRSRPFGRLRRVDLGGFNDWNPDHALKVDTSYPIVLIRIIYE